MRERRSKSTESYCRKCFFVFMHCEDQWHEKIRCNWLATLQSGAKYDAIGKTPVDNDVLEAWPLITCGR